MATPAKTEESSAHQGTSRSATRGKHVLVLVVTLLVLTVSLTSVFFRTAVTVIFIPVFLLLVAFCVLSSILVMRKALGEG